MAGMRTKVLTTRSVYVPIIRPVFKQLERVLWLQALLWMEAHEPFHHRQDTLQTFNVVVCIFVFDELPVFLKIRNDHLSTLFKRIDIEMAFKPWKGVDNDPLTRLRRFGFAFEAVSHRYLLMSLLATMAGHCERS